MDGIASPTSVARHIQYLREKYLSLLTRWPMGKFQPVQLFG
jgi:hypothetical protein